MSVLARIFGASRRLGPDGPPLAAGERVLTWAPARDGAPVVATSLGLWLREPRRSQTPTTPTPAPEDTAPSDPAPSGTPSSDPPSDAEDTAPDAPTDAAADTGPDGRRAGTEPDTDWLRYGWAEVHKATWNAGTLTITSGFEVEPGVVADGPVRRVRLTEPGHLPDEVRTRVTRSVAYSSHHPLPSGRGVWVIARRVPGQDGLSWVLRFDADADRTDPVARHQAADLLAAARAATEPAYH